MPGQGASATLDAPHRSVRREQAVVGVGGHPRSVAKSRAGAVGRRADCGRAPIVAAWGGAVADPLGKVGWRACPPAVPHLRSAPASSHSSARSTRSPTRHSAGCPTCSSASCCSASPSVSAWVCFIPPVAIWSVILWGVTGLMVGILAGLMIMTRLSTRAMYKQIDGMPGAAGHVLSTSLGRSWQSSDMPVGVNPKTQEAVYRAVGRGGVVVVGEGARGRLTPSRQRRALQGAARRIRRAGDRDLRRSRRGRCADLEARVDHQVAARRRSTARRWPRSSSASTRSRSRSRRCRSRRASTRRRFARRDRADAALTRLALRPQQHRSGRLVVQAALVGIPDDRGDHDDQQQACAGWVATSPTHAPSRRTSAQAEDAVARAAPA